MKTINRIFRATYSDYQGLDTWQALPARGMNMESLDPFLFLNHHGYQVYPAHNQGLPFGPHPHKDFETVTFIIEGSLVHKDSTGYSSNIKTGGIQWMTAGKGIIHSETSSEEFMENGGPLEILQLWVNLPSRLKNTPPAYKGLEKQDIPSFSVDEERIHVDLISGEWKGHKGVVNPLTDVTLTTIQLDKDAVMTIEVPAEQTVLFYVIKGELSVNNANAQMHDLVTFQDIGNNIEMKATSASLLLFGYGSPTKEPIVAHGPFVMNSQQEIRDAFIEYQEGKMGTWNE
jgi:quercetin 2,3-dioxygenase